MAIEVNIEGTFNSREEAAEAIRDVATDIALGRHSAQAHVSDNPRVFVTGSEDD